MRISMNIQHQNADVDVSVEIAVPEDRGAHLSHLNAEEQFETETFQDMTIIDIATRRVRDAALAAIGHDDFMDSNQRGDV